MPQRKVNIFYVPYWRYLIADIILLAMSVFVVLQWFPLSTQIPFQKYDIFALVFSACWLLTSYFAHRYVRVKHMRMGRSLVRLLAASVVTFSVMLIYMYFLAGRQFLSIRVLITIWLIMVVFCTLFLILSHAYRYATYEEPEVERAEDRGPQHVLKAPKPVPEGRAEEVKEIVVESAGEKAYNYLSQHIDLVSSNTFTLKTAELYNIFKLKYYRFDVIVNFMPLNQIRGINRMFGVVNDKLPDDGLFICCFEPKSTTKKRILQSYPIGINWIVYTCHYLYKRVLPKIIVTSRLYFDITEGKDRVLSRAEVLGRLCYCGFEIVDEHKIDDLVYVIARRAFRPQTVQRRLYGLLVRLNRVGKDGKVFQVYKFRTMHPYSEFLQSYIYEKYSLQEGGKFTHDIRVNTIGRFMRRCWIDELPMILNLLKGDMKLVGVRPISKQYFSLYSQELQEKRTKHKPGLLPPFYADMPKTLEEIEASEMRYLVACEEKGTFRTDFIYFWKIFYTIIFKRARSH
ncbi:MAG: sugar transferase [Paludibacteraceae bacterium]|nr:sugar transferase [Paludibacteraceae bacterium]